jgi:WD40 repeat protein
MQLKPALAILIFATFLSSSVLAIFHNQLPVNNPAHINLDQKLYLQITDGPARVEIYTHSGTRLRQICLPEGPLPGVTIVHAIFAAEAVVVQTSDNLAYFFSLEGNLLNKLEMPLGSTIETAELDAAQTKVLLEIQPKEVEKPAYWQVASFNDQLPISLNTGRNVKNLHLSADGEFVTGVNCSSDPMVFIYDLNSEGAMQMIDGRAFGFAGPDIKTQGYPRREIRAVFLKDSETLLVAAYDLESHLPMIYSYSIKTATYEQTHIGTAPNMKYMETISFINENQIMLQQQDEDGSTCKSGVWDLNSNSLVNQKAPMQNPQVTQMNEHYALVGATTVSPRGSKKKVWAIE